MQVLKRFLILIFIGSVLCVDRNNFKTCSQSSFCRRCRDMEPNKSPYELNMDSLQVTSDSVHIDLWNTDEQALFNFSLTTLVDSTFRIKIDEANPLRGRFQAHMALKSDPVVDKLEVIKRDKDEISVKNGNNVAVLLSKPFRINFFTDDILVASFNSRGLFRFEHFRKREQKPEPSDNENPEDSEANAGNGEEHQKTNSMMDDPGTWEENFKSFRDSKPFGPSAVAMDVSFPGAWHAYGLPEHADPLTLKDTKGKTDPYRLYNLDVFEYELNNPMAIYGGVPLLYAHGPRKTVGIFWNNPSETWVDVTSSSNSENNVMNSIVNFVAGRSKSNKEENEYNVDTHFMSETGVVDAFVFLGPKPKDIVRQYTRITGVHPLPQYFSLGYHQSRWNYNDEQDVRSVSENFDKYDIPLEVIWLDIEYTDQKKYFTWDPIRFPHPTIMQQNLTAEGRKLIIIIDPHIKRESGYFLHETALANNYYVNNAEGNVYEGWCWPGSSSYLDFFNPVVLEYYSSLYGFDKFPGGTNDLYIWNDMNEPSVFNGPEITMPKDNMHYGGWEHRDVHNIYGLLQVKGTYDGLLARSKGTKRPFVLTRAFYAGSQRYSAVWTGDNAADWGHLAISIPMCLSIGLAGLPFCGADIGGFFGNPETELLIRWYQTGAFLPFYRAHSHLETKRREPYLLQPDTRSIVRNALRKRYTFLPYWYTLFRAHEAIGMPVIRPLFMEYPDDSEGWTVEATYMIGSALLAHPVTERGASSVQIYFPGGETEFWYDIDTHKKYLGSGLTSFSVDITTIPVFQKGGTIIPKKERVRRSSILTFNDPYTLVIALDVKGEASGTLYIDDGESFEYQKNKYLYLHFEFKNGKLVAKKIAKDAHFDTKSWLERVVIVGYTGKAKSAVVVSPEGTQKLEVIPDATSSTLTIRKPNVVMSNEWAITLKE